MTGLAETAARSDLAGDPAVSIPHEEDLLWTFGDGNESPNCLLGYTVLGTDRRIGRVSAVVHVPGRARLEVVVRRWPATGVRTIPAGVVATIDHGAQLVLLNLPRIHVDEAPRGPLVHDGEPGPGTTASALCDHYRDDLHR